MRSDKRAAEPIAKCLNSAIANATFKAEQQNIAIDPDDLWVRTCYVDIGPTKGRSRMRPAPQGRAYRERRHYCHITIEVTSEQKAKTEQEQALETARNERIAARKAERAANAPAKKEKKAAQPSDETIPTPVEPTAQSINAAADIVSQPIDDPAKGDAEVADAKNVETQTPEALNDTKPADEHQLDRNEELERQ